MSANIGFSMTQQGKRVLVIDGRMYQKKTDYISLETPIILLFIGSASESEVSTV